MCTHTLAGLKVTEMLEVLVAMDGYIKYTHAHAHTHTYHCFFKRARANSTPTGVTSRQQSKRPTARRLLITSRETRHLLQSKVDYRICSTSMAQVNVNGLNLVNRQIKVSPPSLLL